MSHNVETMAFRGQLPWWGIGTDLKAGDVVTDYRGEGRGTYMGAATRSITGQEMLKAAGLDWEVELQPMVLEANMFQNVPDHFAICRTLGDERQVLGVVGKRYTPVQNADLFAVPDMLVDQGRMSYETAGSLQAGRLVWALAQVGSTTVQRRNGDLDRLDQYMLWTAAHDGSASVVGGLTTVRVVCNNTLDAAMPGLVDRVKVRHTASAPQRIEEAQRVMLAVTEARQQVADAAQGLEDTPMDAKGFVEFSAAFLDETRGAVAPAKAGDKEARAFELRQARREEAVADMLQLFQHGKGNHGETRWDGYNAVTEWLDHHRKEYQDAKAAQERHFQSTLLGNRYAMKTKALALLRG